MQEQLSRFRVLFQVPYSSPFNVVETVWAAYKREHLVRLHRRERDFPNAAAFEQAVLQLCDDVPIDPDAMLRANRSYIEHYLALGDEQSSDSF